MHGYPSARRSLSRHTCPTPAVLPDENAFIESWDADIVRAATAGAKLLPGRAVLADDLAQMVRTRILRLLRERGITSPHYIRRAMKNAIIDGVRRERRHPDADLDYCVDPSEIPDEMAVHQAHVEEDLTARLSHWIATLPPRLVQVFELLYVHRLTQRDAARIMRVSQPRVAKLHALILQRGRRELMPVVI